MNSRGREEKIDGAEEDEPENLVVHERLNNRKQKIDVRLERGEKCKP